MAAQLYLDSCCLWAEGRKAYQSKIWPLIHQVPYVFLDNYQTAKLTLFPEL